MHFLASIIPALIVLGVLIIIHELGHFIACRMTGIRVEKFSIGFGPEIFHWQGKTTRYAVSLFPLGGFVKPAGESISEVESGVPQPGDYLAAPLWVRIFIVVAGVLMNYLLAFVLFTSIFVLGRPIPGTMVGGFVDGYPAKTSGLQIGDRIMTVQGQDVKTWKELTDKLETAPVAGIDITVTRNDVSLPFKIVPKVETVQDISGKKIAVKRLGITPDPHAFQYEKYSFVPALKAAWKTEWYLTSTTHKAIFHLILGQISMKSISGPIGIISMAGSAVQLGLPYILQLAATLSVSLAVINLLPIPALDGGHLLFLLIEGITRRRVSLQVQERATQMGFLLLLGLMVFIMYNDLVNISAFEKIGKMLGK